MIDVPHGRTVRKSYTVADGIYREAARHILRVIKAEQAAAPSVQAVPSPAIESRPIIFRNAVPEILAEGRRPVAGVQSRNG
jgi:hypothetical protein